MVIKHLSNLTYYLTFLDCMKCVILQIFLTFVICYNFFLHSKLIFIFVPNLVFFFLKEGSQKCVSIRYHQTWMQV